MAVGERRSVSPDLLRSFACLDNRGGPKSCVFSRYVSFRHGNVDVETSSQYDGLAERLVHAGCLETVLRPADFRRHQQQIHPWRGAECERSGK